MVHIPKWEFRDVTSTMRFSVNFSKSTMMISRRWSIRLSLSKTRLKRWRRMARGRQHSRDSLWEATPGLAYLSQGLSSETGAWFAHLCIDNVLHSICKDRTFRNHARTSRCRSLSLRLIKLVCSNGLTRAYSKVLTIVGPNPPTGVDKQHESREAQSLYPSAMQLTCTVRLKFIGRAT
jgi:hypothetical protein